MKQSSISDFVGKLDTEITAKLTLIAYLKIYYESTVVVDWCH